MKFVMGGCIRCQYCDGHGSYKCIVCHGYGIIILAPFHLDLSLSCNNCNRKGYEECDVCYGKGKLKCCGNGRAPCPVCWGTGSDGQEDYSESYTLNCTSCNGEGRVSRWCAECYGTGKVTKKRVVQKKRSEI